MVYFDGIETRVVTGLHKMDSAEGACSKSSLDGKVDDGIFALGCPHCVLLGGRELGGNDAVVWVWDGSQEAGGRAYHGFGGLLQVLLIARLWLRVF